MYANPGRPAAVLFALLAAAVGGCGGPDEGGPAADQALGPWAWEMPRCVAYQPAQYEAPEHRVAVTVADGSAVVEEYEVGWGTRAVAEIRAVLRTCGSFEDGDQREQNLVVEAGFAADESLLVEIVRLAPPGPVQTSYAAVVRDGDVVVTVRSSELGREEALCLAGVELATCAAGRA